MRPLPPTQANLQLSRVVQEQDCQVRHPLCFVYLGLQCPRDALGSIPYLVAREHRVSSLKPAVPASGAKLASLSSGDPMVGVTIPLHANIKGDSNEDK